MFELVNQLSESNNMQSEQIIRDMEALQRDVTDIKDSLTKLNSERTSRRRFSRRRKTEPVEETKSNGQLDELLPLLPHLSQFIPQINNPKVVDTVKVLSNPAVLSMIQQFVNNGGLKPRPIAYQKRK